MDRPSRAHARGYIDLAQHICDEVLADSDGDDSVVDSEFVRTDTGGEALFELR